MSEMSEFELFFVDRGVPPDQARQLCHDTLDKYSAIVNDFTFNPHCPYLRHAAKILKSDYNTKCEENNIQSIGQSFDFIGANLSVHSIGKALNLTALVRKPTKGIAIVATVRNEGPFLLEWIAHNINIGVEHFYIYTNDNDDSSDLLLRALAELNIITVIFNDVSQGVNPQIKAYDHALHFIPELREYNWIYYADADEFLVPNGKIDEFLSKALDLLGNNLGSVSFNWLWMGSSGLLTADRSKFVTERFHHGQLFSGFVKSFVRPNFVYTMMNVHKPLLAMDIFGVNSSLNKINMQGHDIPFDTTNGVIRHYWNKSFEEFLVKQSRGKDRDIWERDTELFFDWDVPIDIPSSLFPPDLANGLMRIYKFIKKLSGVTITLNIIEERYCRLASNIRGDVGIEELHIRALRARKLLKAIDRRNSENKSSPTSRDIGKILELNKQ